MQAYNLESDFEYQREFYLKISLIVTAIISVFVCAIAVTFHTTLLPIPIALLVMTKVSSSLCDRKRTAHAVWVYLIGLTCSLAAVLLVFTANTALCLLMLVPIVLSTLLLKQHQLFPLAGLCIVLMYIISAIQVGFIAAVFIVVGPALLGLLLATVMYANVGSMMELVYWATDVQQKDTKRAESFYRQKEQLADTLRLLSYAHSQLETLNKDLIEAQAKADRANKAKSVFLSNMSHELRTPLNVLIGYASTMLERPNMYGDIPLPAPYRADVQLIQDNSYHLLTLINDILDLSKIEAGKLTLNQQATPLPALFASCLSTAIGLVKDKPIQIRPDFSQDLPIVWADPIRIRQIILNLMSNAVKFTHVGSVTLRAQVEEGWVRISVIDTGIGIPEGALKHIFDRFEQAERDTEKRYGGTGLGLDISKQLARMHGSDLTVESRVGTGSTFSFALPLYVPQDHDGTPPTTLIAENSTAQLLDTDGAEILRSIMVVEDNVVQHALMHRTLESNGYVVINVHDGSEVLDMASALVPDLIILDILLPNFDGWEIYRTLKTNDETSMIPVLLCTAIPRDEFPSDICVEHFLSKPFSSDDLITTVQDLVGMSYAPYSAQD